MKRAAVSAIGLLIAAATACRGPYREVDRRVTSAPAGPVQASSSTRSPSAQAAGSADPAEPPPRPLRRCFPGQPAWVDAAVADLLDHAADLFDAGDYTGALACAEEAARQSPRSVEAHHNRAVA